jgi:hypothetical protein
MAITTIVDLPESRALDYQAKLAICGAGAGDWCVGLFPFYLPPAVAGVCNFYQQNIYEQINTTYIGQQVNQVTALSITNSGANATNTAVLLGSTSNHG